MVTLLIFNYSWVELSFGIELAEYLEFCFLCLYVVRTVFGTFGVSIERLWKQILFCHSCFPLDGCEWGWLIDGLSMGLSDPQLLRDWEKELKRCISFFQIFFPLCPWVWVSSVDSALVYGYACWHNTPDIMGIAGGTPDWLYGFLIEHPSRGRIS